MHVKTQLTLKEVPSMPARSAQHHVVLTVAVAQKSYCVLHDFDSRACSCREVLTRCTDQLVRHLICWLVTQHPA